jgi:ubiquinone/menaquinone biosynthesis C-methylase UbiE
MNQTPPDIQTDTTSYWAGHFDTQVAKNPDDSVKALNFSNTRLMNQVHTELLSCIDWSWFFPGDHLLDTGCGTGVLLCRLISAAGTFRQDLYYHATDISRGMLDKARAAAGQQIPEKNRCRFYCMSVDNMGFCDRKFSLVMASESLQYTDPYTAILELIRMTRKNGQIIISIPNSWSPFIRKAEQKHAGRFSGIEFQKAADLIRPKVADFQAKPLLFGEDQTHAPYLSKPLTPDLIREEIHAANRFILRLVI